MQNVKQHLDKDGEPFVVLEDNNGDRVVRKVCVLVAEAFVPNPNNKSNIRHKNGNVADNRADNLEWV